MKLTKTSLALFLASASSFALAEGVEEVIITASPFATNTESLNHPANVMSGEALQNAAAATLGDTLNGQLGVSSASFGPGVGLPIIRGQSDNRVKVMQDSVGSMDASAASPDHAVTLEPLLATKIEVLRGPAALRYGSGAIGGVVNLLDNRIPDQLPEQLTGGAELRHGSDNDETVGVASLTGALGDVALHIDGVKRDANDMEIPGLAAKNAANPAVTTKGYVANTDASSTSGTVGGSYIGDDGFVGLSINQLDNNYGVPPDGNELVRIDMHQTRYDLKGELNHPFAGAEKFTAHLGHADYRHTEMENGQPGTRFTNDAYEGRAELILAPLDDWKGALGIQAATSTFAAIGEEAFIPKSDIASGGIFILEERSAGSITYELGLRGDAQQITPVGGDTINHRSLNLSGSASWNFTENQKLSLGLAQSQRAPSVEELLANGPHPATGSFLTGDAKLHEETSNNLELGYHWHNEATEFSVNAFYNQLSDFIYAKNLGTEIDGLKAFRYVQANATFRGAETELKIALNDEWKLRLFSDYVRATLDNGGDLPRITPLRMGSSVDFTSGNWSANLSATRAAPQDHPGAGEDTTDGYTRVDARLDYHLHHGGTDYTLFLKATNVLDAEIRNASSYLRDIAPEAGRNLQVGLRMKF